ncbi:hypothetical protein CFOL_v3_05680, partial [Cephalotus follicularis]
LNPYTPLDLIPLPISGQVNFEASERAKNMKKPHESIRAKIEKANDAYKRKANKHRRKTEFQQGDLVWVNLRKERFPSRRKSKLAPRADGPFEVLERVGDN